MKGFLGLLLFADGIATIIGGRGFLHWLRVMLPARTHSVIDALLEWPEPLLRWASLLQTILGVLLLAGPEERVTRQTIKVEIPVTEPELEPEPVCTPVSEPAC